MKTKLQLKAQQKLSLTLAIQQALKVLQLPIMDLVPWVQLQIEENPLLQPQETPPSDTASELDFNTQGFEVLDHLDDNFSQNLFPEVFQDSPQELPATPSLYDHLMSQAKMVFDSLTDLTHAEQIIGHLDERGFLTDFNARPEILAKVHQFDPPGIGARGLQECLLLQLSSDSFTYIWVRDHYSDLLEGRCPKSVQKELASLNFYPGARFHSRPTISPIPDIILESTDSQLQIIINEEPLPRFQLLSSPELPHFFRAGKWVEKVLVRRRQILTQIMQSLLKIHHEFFFENGALHPLSLQHMAQKLGLNPSTVARAVKDKYVACPRGMFLLKEFFPYSHTKTKQLLKKLIAAEDKQRPYSDQALVQLMSEAGIPCARRTIAKYRKLLRIPTASRRRAHGST